MEYRVGLCLGHIRARTLFAMVGVHCPGERNLMELGAFSVSLAVKDMAVSRDFYSKLGFEMVAGDGDTWTILANQPVVIGLFQGMFEGNILTFNPGWEGLGQPVEDFTDIRVLSSEFSANGLQPGDDMTGATSSGPASFTVTDPDGNAILFDQHV